MARKPVDLVAAGLVALATVSAAVASPQEIEDCFPETGPETAFEPYFVDWHGNGFVLYYAVEKETAVHRFILENCPANQVLAMTLQLEGRIWPGDDHATDRVTEPVLEAVESARTYTMWQIEAIARAGGARTVVGDAAYESCACEQFGQVE